MQLFQITFQTFDVFMLMKVECEFQLNNDIFLEQKINILAFGFPEVGQDKRIVLKETNATENSKIVLK